MPSKAIKTSKKPIKASGERTIKGIISRGLKKKVESLSQERHGDAIIVWKIVVPFYLDISLSPCVKKISQVKICLFST